MFHVEHSHACTCNLARASFSVCFTVFPSHTVNERDTEMQKRKARGPKTPAAPKPPRQLTDEQRMREKALLDKGLTKSAIHYDLTQRGIELSRATVGYVIEGQFRNEAVIEAFCRLTETDAETMFPQT